MIQSKNGQKLTAYLSAIKKLEHAEETKVELTLEESKAILQKISDMEDVAEDAWYERNTRD